MGFLTEHQHTEISDIIDDLVELKTKSYDSGNFEVHVDRLVRSIRSREHVTYNDNQAEAARKLRKLLKYNDSLQIKLRCFDILEFFILNDLRYDAMYNDAKLLSIIKLLVFKSKKFQKYLISWYAFITENRLQDKNAFIGFINLYQVFKHAGAASSSARFDIQKEIPKIKLLISEALSVSISLKNALLQIPNGSYSIDDEQATIYFVKARKVRRMILKYLQVIQAGEMLGSLIHANDQLVEALKQYDEMNGLDANNYDDADDDNNNNNSESSCYETDDESLYNDTYRNKNKNNTSSGNDPFGDHNHI